MKNMIKAEYMISDGKVYEVIGRDGKGLPVCKLTNLKEIPEDKPLKEVKEEVTEEEPVKKTRKTKK